MVIITTGYRDQLATGLSGSGSPRLESCLLTRAEVLFLFRSFLRTVKQFSDYNIREYTRRRAADAFRENRALKDTPAAAVAFAKGKQQLEVAKRQAALYAPKAKSVMELKVQ
ncbi:unnamed protein product [Miscanthus lutarioriparius]|uniref:Complex 1 LYR protein domain-containing protein n=1 Tax=Miscanthus lutarioriparius TaxID=422564 RepID=A0A811MS01_9POAL|nr:unnamed protein product [Miscanthus lutarioriparius]